MIMKKIFTLLFCVMAMSFAANATDNLEPVYHCINVLLNQNQTTNVMTTNLDANHDGAISIADVTTLIDMALLANKPAAQAPANEPNDEDRINDMLNDVPPVPTVSDLTDTIDKKLSK